MKKLSILMLALIGVVSCKKDGFTTSDNLLHYNVNLKRLTSVVGRVHNEGVTNNLSLKSITSGPVKLQSLFPTNPGTPTPNPSGPYSALDINNIITSSYDYVLSQPEFSGSERGIPAQVVSPIISIIYAADAATIDLKVDSTVATLRQLDIMTVREAGMIKEIQDIFTDGYALNMTQANAGVYFATRLDQLKAKYANILWNLNEGEAYLGALEIAISSNQYWHANSLQPTIGALIKAPQGKLMSTNKTMDLMVPPFTPGDPEIPIVQVDLVAYILSWGWQVYNQYMAGTLDESGQYDRISKGLQAAITASTLRLIKTNSVPITFDLFLDSGSIPIEGGDAPTLNFPDPILDPVFYTNEYAFIGSNYSPPFLSTNVYKNGDFYYYDLAYTKLLPDGYYILNGDLSINKYYRVANGKVIEIAQATNDPNAPVPPYIPYNPFIL